MSRRLLVHLRRRLRVLATTAGAAFTGLFNIATHRDAESRVELRPGDEVPDFALTASDGQTYQLSAYRGRQAVVIAWFPKAFTGGCASECESIGARSDAIRRFDVAYFGASVDTPTTNRRFAASLGVDFPILSDPTKAVARAHGVLGRSGFPSRWTFYIGIDGRILAIDKRVRTGLHGFDIEKALSEFQITLRG